MVGARRVQYSLFFKNGKCSTVLYREYCTENLQYSAVQKKIFYDDVFASTKQVWEFTGNRVLYYI